MARVDLIVCENCGAEVVETQQVRASMTQLVVTQGGSRSHVYDLCPNCAAGVTTTLPENPAEWPRFVAREAVQAWLRVQQAGLLREHGNPWDDPARRAQGVPPMTTLDTIREAMRAGDERARRDVNTPEGGDPEGYH